MQLNNAQKFEYLFIGHTGSDASAVETTLDGDIYSVKAQAVGGNGIVTVLTDS